MSNPGAASSVVNNYQALNGTQISSALRAAPSAAILADATTIYQTPDGALWQSTGTVLIQILTSAQSAGVAALGLQSPVSSTWRTMQDAINAYGQVSLPEGTSIVVANPVLMGNDCTVNMSAGTTLLGSGDTFHNIFRAGNAEWADFTTSAGGGIFGVYVGCADPVTATAAGSIRYTQATTSLAYAGPNGAFGSEVSVAAVVSGVTEQFFVLTDSLSQQIMVRVAVNANRNANATRAIRIEPVQGVVSITWTRTSNIVTVSEPGHKRCGGYFFSIFGTLQGHFFIKSTTTTTWSFAQAGADVSTPTAGKVYGVRNWIWDCAGARLDYQKTLSYTGGQRDGMHVHAIPLCWVNGSYGTPPNTLATQKYAMFAHGCFDIDMWDLQYEDAGSDGFHITGPARKVFARNITGRNGDNTTAVGTTDYPGQYLFGPSYGTVDVTNWGLTNIFAIDTIFEPVRIYTANAAKISGGVVGPVFGTWTGAAVAPVSIITDVLCVDAAGGGFGSSNTNTDDITFVDIRCLKSDGTQNPMINFAGTGTRTNTRCEKQQLQPVSGLATGTIVVNSGTTMEDLYIDFADGLSGFCGAGIDVRGTGRVKDLKVTSSRIRGDNTLNAATQPVLVLLEASTSQIDHLDISGVNLVDISGSGTKAALVFNKGTLSTFVFDRLKLEACESLLKASSTAATTTIVRGGNSELDVTFCASLDALIARLGLANVHVTGTVAQLNATGNIRVVVAACLFDARFLRNVTGNSSIWVKATSCLAGTPIQIDAGTPLIKADGDWDMAFDGALLDATVTNNAPGAKFYNTNAGFVSGVGAYARGAAAWVRIAA